MKNKILVCAAVLVFTFLAFNFVNAQVKSNNVITQPSQDTSCLWKKGNINGVPSYFLKDLGSEYVSFADPRQTWKPVMKLKGSNYTDYVLDIEGVENGISLTTQELGIAINGGRRGISINVGTGVADFGIQTNLGAAFGTGYTVNGPGQGTIGYEADDVGTAFQARNTNIAADLQGDVILRDNAGNGNAYACFDSTGKLFRSATPCVAVSAK
jgi:hypothetical protein